MKRFAAAATAAATAFTLALAPGVSNAAQGLSELSATGGLSMLIGSAVIIASPFIVVGEIVDASAKGDRVAVRVRNDRGQPDTLELPKDVVAKANLQPGDRLTVKPAKSGAILAKNDTPIAFLVPPENAQLSHSHALAR